MRADRLSRWFVRCAAVVAVGGVLGLPAAINKASEWEWGAPTPLEWEWGATQTNTPGAVTADEWEWGAAATVVPIERLAG